MDYIKRAFLYLRRRIGKSLLLILVTTTSLIVMLTGLTIQNAVLRSSKNNQKPLGNTVILSSRRQEAFSGTLNSAGFWSYPVTDPGQALISQKIVKRLANFNHLVRYQIHSRTSVQAASFKLPPVEVKNGQQAAEESSSKNDRVVIFGLSANLDDPNFRNHNYFITKGRGIDRSDLGSHNVVIEKTLALADNIDIGDIIRVRDSNHRVSSLKVVGIYTARDASGHLFTAFEDPARTIFASYSLASSLAGNPGLVQQVAYTVTSAKQEKLFMQKANRVVSTPLQLTSVNDLYDSLSRWIGMLMQLALRLIWSALLVGTTILFVILALVDGQRKKEICLLTALGEKPAKIVAQFFAETGLILFVSLVFTGCFGNFFSSLLGQQMITETAIFSQPLGASVRLILIFLSLIMVAAATGLSLIPIFSLKNKKFLF